MPGRIEYFIPWLQQPGYDSVVDEKRKISSKDALPMIERLGMEPYLFSQAREEEHSNDVLRGFIWGDDGVHPT
ncbi:hypothetical protein SUGI_1014230 [Cryptomeria japonica]|nr:hypothetical protein SUGI_1014230 [Cryptomeria japonica]